MPVELSINHQNRLCILRGNGILTAEDFLALNNNDLNLFVEHQYNQLADLRDVEHLKLKSAECLSSMARFLTSMNPGSNHPKLAIIVTTDLLFAMARLFEVYLNIATNGSKKTGVFRTPEEAFDFVNNTLGNSSRQDLQYF